MVDCVRSSVLGAEHAVMSDVSVRWVLAYAASLGFDGARYLDDAQPGGPEVVPTFCVCPEWAVVGDPAWSDVLGLDLTQQRRRVHAMQDSVFHEPIRAGMRVETRARLVFMRNTSAGTYLCTRLETREAATADLLVTSWSGTIIRGVPLDAEVVGVAHEGVAAEVGGDAVACDVPTARGLPHVYSEAARIWNPIHTERAVALAAGLADIVLHGTASWGLAAREMMRGRQGVLRRLSARFRQPLVAGEAFTLRCGVGAEAAGFTGVSASGRPILEKGVAVFGAGKAEARP